MKYALAAALLLSTSLALAGPPAQHAVPHRQKPPFPVLSLPDAAAGGQRAIDALGQRLPEVAAWYGKSADELRAQLLADKRMKIDRRGRVFFIEEMEQPLAAEASPGLLDGSYAPLEQTFLLHSKPGANRTIYLNFRGATLTGTAWNGSGGSINAPAFDLDGVPGSYSTTELQRIQGIWQRVAEDFAPFDVNVTTEAPPPDRLTRSGSTDTVFGTTVLITTRAGVYSCSCGGVAYLGIFDDTSDYYKPALVFYDALGNGSEKYVAEAATHEAGHNMGLSHDGSPAGGYYTGHGSGATGWAPIMGVGYYQALTQWSKGEYLDANNKQDDYVVMQGNGLPLRADDHGNSLATATLLPAGGGTLTGLIERPDDVDVFVFSATAGTASFTLSPAVRAPNLDAVLTLRNAAGSVLASWNPVDALNAGGSFVLPAAGTYSLEVRGTGKGDPLGSGYSAYGSLGQYRLTASFGGVSGSAPTAVISASTLRGTAPLAVSFSGAGSSDADGSIAAYQWTLGNGQTASGVSASTSYATPGLYSVQLTVTDNSGLSASSSVNVQVDAPVVTLPMRVADIGMSLVVNKGGNARADAAVRLVDGDGRPVAGAVVTGAWSGLVTQNGATATSDGNGVARFSSPTSKRSGVFVFTVSGVSANGYQYQPATNTETTDSIQR